jgi:DNA end-binding protein Ku
MARAIWTGALSFGLVNIPVALHTAVRDSRPRFRLLHAKDKSPIRLERVCQRERRSVAWEDLVKGYEYSKGRFVVLTKKDFAAAAVEKTRRIDILDFVSAETIDDRHFETPYYLTPGTGGDTAYALLREAIRETGRTGIGKFVLRDVQHLVAVSAIDDALVLFTLRFADELVDTGTLSFPNPRLKGQELTMAKQLVETLAAEWAPDKYTDDYHKNLMRLIKAKAKGQSIELTPEARTERPEVADLMERLRRSLQRSNGKPARATKRRRTPRVTGRSRRSTRTRAA